MKQEEDFEANLAGEDGQGEEARRSWFKRIKKGILTSTAEKKETPEGLWSKCPECGYICTMTELRESLFVCPKCSHHHRIGSAEYFEILFDDNQYEVLFENIRSKDFLHLSIHSVCQTPLPIESAKRRFPSYVPLPMYKLS